MQIIAIKQGYIVRSVLFVSFLFVMSLGLIGGCSDGGGGNDSQALTENDFAEDSALKANLKGVVVTFLESPMSEEAENDTGQVGIDLIPVAYKRTTEQMFCWEDDDVDAMHFMELRDSEGNLILTVQVNGDCVTEEIEEGDYVLAFHHDETIGDALPIFLIPNPEESEQARKSEGLIDRFKQVASNVLKQIERTVTKDAKAQTTGYTDFLNRRTLIRRNKCVGCNLQGADFVFVPVCPSGLTPLNLNGADLTDADLRRANFCGVRLSGAIFKNANMIGTILTGANLSGADFTGAELSVAEFNDATLTDAIFTDVDSRNAFFRRAILIGADLTDADFRFVDFTKANLTNVTLSNTDFSFATWCDGICRCLQDSIDTCSGCTPFNIASPIDICTGP